MEFHSLGAFPSEFTRILKLPGLGNFGSATSLSGIRCRCISSYFSWMLAGAIRRISRVEDFLLSGFPHDALDVVIDPLTLRP